MSDENGVTIEGIDEVLNAINLIERNIQERQRYFVNQLAVVAQESLQESYDEAVANANALRDLAWLRGDKPNWSVQPIEVSVEEDTGADNPTFIVSAEGQDVCFVVFGAGMYAGVAPDSFSSEMSIGIYPGSWSRYHEKTWNYWIGKGYPKEEYPYNIYPASAFAKAYAKILNSIPDLSHKVFGDLKE